MKFLFKLTIRLLIVAILIIAAAYMAAPYILENVLLRQLQHQGLENISIRVGRPKWDAIKLNWISFESRQGQTKWLVEARDSSAQINPLELLRGNLPTLNVAQAYLKIDSRSRRVAESEEELTLSYPAEWLALVPIRSFKIDQLSIDWQGKEQTTSYDSHLYGTRIADRIELVLEIERESKKESEDDSQRIRYESKLLMTTSGQLSLTVLEQDQELISEQAAAKPWLSFKARLTERNDAIEISRAELIFEPLALNQFARESQLFQPVEAKISGQVRLIPRGHVNKKIIAGSPLKYRIAGDLIAKLDSVAAPFYAYDTQAEVYANFDIDHVSARVTIDSKTKIETAPPDSLLAFAKSSPHLLPMATNQPLTIDVVEPLHFESDMALVELVNLERWRVKGMVTASLPLQDGQRFLLSVESPIISASDVMAWNSSYRMQLPFNEILLDSGVIAASSLQLSGLISARSDQLSFSIDHHSSWQSSQIQINDYVFNKPKLGVRKGVAVHYDVAAQRLRSNNAQLVMQFEPLSLGGYELASSNIDVDVEQALAVGDKWTLSGALSTQMIVNNKASTNTLPFYITAAFKADQKAVTGTHSLSLTPQADNEKVLMSGELAYDWQESTGGVNWHAGASPIREWIDALLIVAPSIDLEQLQIEEGAIDAELSLLLLADDTKVKADVRTTGVAASHGEMRINGGNSRIIIDDVLGFSSKKKSTLALALFDVGFPIEDIRLSLQPQRLEDGTNEFLVTNFSAKLLGGRIGSKSLIWRPGQISQFDITVRGVDLEQVLALEQQEGLKGSGLIDGMIPISVSADGDVSIDSGRLQARSPGGVLAYRGKDINALVKDNQGLEIVAKVLQDFRYQNLNAKVQYQPNGDMVLALSIVGHNPDFENGRQINLNVNVEENVKSLLQSLQLADDLADKIDQRVQQGLKQNTDNKE